MMTVEKKRIFIKLLSFLLLLKRSSAALIKNKSLSVVKQRGCYVISVFTAPL